MNAMQCDLGSAAPDRTRVAYDDETARAWLELYSPDEWHGHVLMQFCWARFEHLLPAGSLRRPYIVEEYVKRLRQGKAIAPPIACRSREGQLYLHDGNHRYYALREYFGPGCWHQQVRVGLMLPKKGYEFAWVERDGWGTYELRPKTEAHLAEARSGPQASATAGG